MSRVGWRTDRSEGRTKAGPRRRRQGPLLAACGLRALCLPLLLTGGCTVGDLAGNLAGSAVGGQAGEVARATVGAGAELQSANAQMSVAFSAEQEYHLGRAAAAELIARFGLDPDPTRQDYIRHVGAGIVAMSTRLYQPHGGWHFGVLDHDEANGWSAPGGYVFVTRGALLRAENEDEVAAIVAHEMSHIQAKHAEKLILRGRRSGALAAGLGRLVGGLGGDQGVVRGQAQLLGELGGEVVAEMVRTGYGRDAEFEADAEGALLLYDVGYDPRAMRTYLEATAGRQSSSWSTHPPPGDRIAALEQILSRYGGDFEARDAADREARAARFHQAVRLGVFAPAVEPPLEEVLPPADDAPLQAVDADGNPPGDDAPPADLPPPPTGAGESID